MSFSAVKFTYTSLSLLVVLLKCGWAQDDSNNSQVKVAPIPLKNLEDLVGDGRGAIARQKCKEYSQYVNDSKCPPSFSVNVTALGSLGKVRAAATEFPHMAAVGFESAEGETTWVCGGTLISETFVLTAADCINSRAFGPAVKVRVGDLNLNRTDDGAMPQERRIVEQIVYPEYKPPVAYHNIGLLRLESPVPFNNWIRPACLHTTLSAGAQEAVATGWGEIEFFAFESSPDLLKVSLPLVDQPTCVAKWENTSSDLKLPKGIVHEWLICAGALHRDTCTGDGGGPLTIRTTGTGKELCMYDVIGITNTGRGCGLSYPALYTRVYHYVPWIESVVWGQG